VPDPEFKELVEKVKPKSVVPAYLACFDIAGLVKGAADGEGLGNAFLSHISACDAIFHVVRTFEDTADGEKATHVEDSVDPIRDLEIIRNELRLKDVATIEKYREPLAKEVGRDGKAKEKKDRLEIIDKILEFVKVQEKEARFGEWNAKETDVLNDLFLLTSKSALHLVNMSKPDFLKQKNKWLPKIKAWIEDQRPGEKMVFYSATMEAELVELPDDEARQKYLTENKTRSQINKIVQEGYHTLQLVHFYTSGPDECRCWTIRDGWLAPKAAGTIHTDFERGFIKAEVYNWKDWKENDCSEAAVKEKGKYRQEGKNYQVKDKDIIFFKFNVTADAKKK